MPRPKKSKITTTSHHIAPTQSTHNAKAAPTPSKSTNTSIAPTPSSVISIANFKRRPRQPSILRMVQQAAAASASEIEDSFSHGSILSKSRLNHTSQPALDDEEDVSYLTLPHSSSPARQAAPSPPCRVALKERKPDQVQPHNKRKLSRPSEGSSVQSKKRKRYSNADKENRTPLLAGVRLDETEPITISSPRSSSQLGSSPPPLQASRLFQSSQPAKRLRTPAKLRQTTISKAKESKPRPTPANVSTATLQGLMPQRRTRPQLRQRKNDEFAIFDSRSSLEPSSDQDDTVSAHENDDSEDAERDDDADELELPARKARYVENSRRSEKSVHRNTESKAKPKGSIKTKPTRSTRTAPATATTTSKPKTKTKSTTSSPPRSESTHSNASPSSPSDAESSTIISPQGHSKGKTNKSLTSKPVQSDELAAARANFADVDAWELSFESADLGGAGGSSSPWR